MDDLGSLIINVLALPPEERIDFLDEVCGSDAGLRDEVESMVAVYDRVASTLEEEREGTASQRRDSSGKGAGAFTPDPYMLIGRTMGDYRVLEHLGGGGMGVVYKAEKVRGGRLVALKFLPPAAGGEERAQQRFRREARVASSLQHPNICTVYDINETKAGLVFIAMACYEGETLRKKIARGPLPLATALRYAVQVADGLAHAHAQGVIHRDIKPTNVMVTKADEVKILDFGLAKLIGSAQLTRPGARLGTVAYMAPEQARGEHVDHRTDIWALGVILYEMITGTRPFPGTTYQNVLDAVLTLNPLPVTSLRPATPMPLALAIHKALTKTREKRNQRMDHLLAMLQVVRQRL